MTDATRSRCFLGIDLGTSAVKAILIDDDQASLASAIVPLRTSRPLASWSEQEPDAWWEAVENALANLRHADPAAMRRVTAVGLSGQMHGAVLLDATGRPLRPAILWNDYRASTEAHRLHAEAPWLAAMGGVTPSPSFVPPKLLWLRTHEPDRLAKLSMLLMPKDYLRYRMTGRFQTDGCDAAGTLLMDVGARRWSAASLGLCGISEEQLPIIVEGSEAAAMLDLDIARRWGLDPDLQGGIVVAGGAGDAAAGAIGIGAIADGDAYISLGTSAQVFVTTDSYRPAPEMGVQSFAHALPGRWFQAAAVLNGASCLAWAVQLLGHDTPAELLHAAESRYRGPSSLLFLPYLTGERSPHNDPHARGVLLGLTPETTPSELVQAVLEGVAFSLADALETLRRAGTEVRQAALVGGGARSAFWTRLIATITGIPLVRYVATDSGPALGAARLARMALTGEAPSEHCTPPDVLDRTLPNPADHRAYATSLARYRALYQVVKPLFV